MVKVTESCALCGLDITGSPISHVFDNEEKHFCCQGCERVYTVAYDNKMLDQVLTQPKLKTSALADVVFNPGETAYFSIGGMWCAGCAVAAEKVLRNQKGIKSVDISFAAERGRIQYDPLLVTPTSALHNLSGLGYSSNLLSDGDDQKTKKRNEGTLLQLITAAAFGMQVMIFYIVQLYPQYARGFFNTHEVRIIQYLIWLLATPIFFYGGSSFLVGAWRALRARTATMDTLVALGTISAYSYSVYVTLTGGGEVYFDSVAMITMFVMLGRYLESLGGNAARKGIRQLLSLQPEKAWSQEGTGWKEISSAVLKLGDRILIKPGQRVPADAEILEGQAAIDESLLTGESLPVNKSPGDLIFAGTLVMDNAVICLVNRLAQDTRLSHITQMVEKTLSAKPPIQRLADKASAYFTFGILGTSIITLLGWWATGHSLAQGLLAAVAVLVVACPCALGLATPFALTVTLGRTTQSGILVRNPAALETAANIDRVVFDKTGTLTLGQMKVVSEVFSPEISLKQNELICLAAAVEQYSEHPIAKAIVTACSNPPMEAKEFQALRGLGASARIVGKLDRRVMVGSLKFLKVDDASPLIAQAQMRAEQGQIIIWVGWDLITAGFIALRDDPNLTARKALNQLKNNGINSVMISGDSPITTQAIALELGIVDYVGNCTPSEKMTYIKSWQDSGERVGMIGDGVNDAPALAQADLSITVAGGTDIAGETSDVVLTRPDLTLIPWFIRLCHRTQRIIRENLWWAFAYNIVVVPLAAFGIISPLIAAITMATSSILVVGNSLRLRY